MKKEEPPEKPHGTKQFPQYQQQSTAYLPIEHELGRKKIIKNEETGLSVGRNQANEILILPDIQRRRKRRRLLFCRIFSNALGKCLKPLPIQIVPTQEERRNGYPEKNPGEKGYAVAEYCPGFWTRCQILCVFRRFEKQLCSGGHGEVMTPLFTMDRGWAQSATDALRDKDGMPLAGKCGFPFKN